MAILRALGPRAEVVRSFVALTDAVLYGPAALGRRERELLAVATSEANGAAYSREVHAGLLDGLGGGPDGGERDRALVQRERADELPRRRRQPLGEEPKPAAGHGGEQVEAQLVNQVGPQTGPG